MISTLAYYARLYVDVARWAPTSPASFYNAIDCAGFTYRAFLNAVSLAS